jgi:hypothetical protein
MTISSEVKKCPRLRPNPQVGGFLVSVNKSRIRIPESVLLGFIAIIKKAFISNAITCFPEQTICSLLHRVIGAIPSRFYIGDAMEILPKYLECNQSGSDALVHGITLLHSQHSRKVKHRSNWFGSRLMPVGYWTLKCTTMAFQNFILRTTHFKPAKLLTK